MHREGRGTGYRSQGYYHRDYTRDREWNDGVNAQPPPPPPNARYGKPAGAYNRGGYRGGFSGRVYSEVNEYENGVTNQRKFKRDVDYSSNRKVRTNHGEEDLRQNRYDDANTRMTGQDNAALKKGAKYCVNFAWNGNCRFGTKCRYPHAIEGIAYTERAHDGQPIRCCVLGGADAHGNPEIFTGGKDNRLRRWNLLKEKDATDATKEQYTLQCITCTDLGADICTLIFVSGALFAGLSNGVVRVFLTNGQVQDLKGHETSVHALLIVEGVLISGDWSGCLAFWKYDETSVSFVLSHKMTVEGSITSIEAVEIEPPAATPQPGAVPAATKALWIGGTSLSILDLSSLQVVRTIDISDARVNSTPLVVSMIKFNAFVLVGFASGLIRAYSAAGEANFTYNSDYLSAMAGLDSPHGPVLICGGKRSTGSILKLPQFEEQGSLPMVESGDIKVVRALGPSYFITCGEDSSLSVWKWTDVTQSENTIQS